MLEKKKNEGNQEEGYLCETKESPNKYREWAPKPISPALSIPSVP